MKKLIIILISVMAFFSSCEDYLDQTPDGELTLDEVFSKRNYAEEFLYNTYSYCPDEQNMAYQGFLGWEANLDPFVGASDDMELCWTYPYATLMNSGAWNPSDTGNGSCVWVFWRWYFIGIRKANVFLENVDRVPMDNAEKEQWVGEAHFLRAFYHFNMFRLYGAIPIQDKSIKIDDDFKLIVRKPVDEVVDFIMNECDIAASKLPSTFDASKSGRVTKIAALALKSRLLLYAASSLFNGNADYKNLLNSNGVNLFPQVYDQSKWQLAANAAKECIDEAEKAGYKLYHSVDNDPVSSYQQIFITPNNSEVFFQKNIGLNTLFEYMAAPNGMGGWSGMNPTQNLVDQYEMTNGKQPINGYNNDATPQINSESGYQESGYAATAHPKSYYPAGVRNMYTNRDPRFYASILFNGQKWRGRAVQFYKTGADGKKSGPDYPSTGYIIKKFCEPTVDLPRSIFANKFWIYFRLSEIYLNYAEALNESNGPNDDVYKYVNAIRERVNMPDLPLGLSKEDMRIRIRHERQIELAFETHRYFDCHRWKIAATTDADFIYGLDISTGSSIQDDRFYKRVIIEKRVFESPKHYLWPIPQGEINKNNNLIQNPQW